MGVAPSDVRPGKCFLSRGAKPEVVRVLSLRDDQVRFEVRQRRKAWVTRADTAMSEFVAGLLKEVGSDYEPGADDGIRIGNLRSADPLAPLRGRKWRVIGPAACPIVPGGAH